MVTLPFYDPVSISNRALREVPDRLIGDLTEASLQARECSAAYSDCVAELLEDHPWEFAVARTTLATVANTRLSEWGYAYAVPSDAAFIGRLISPSGDFPDGVPLAGTYLSRGVFPVLYDSTDFMERTPGYARQLVGGTLYSDCPGAVAEYTLNVMPENSFTSQFVRALALMMAVRITPALKKAEASRDLLAREEAARGRAKATDANRQRETYGNHLPDWLAVR